MIETRDDDPDATAHARHRYNQLAPLYDFLQWPIERFLFRRWRKQLWQDVRGEEVLELGIGTGKNSLFYPSALRVTGVDFSPAMLMKARERIRKHSSARVRLSAQNIQALTFADERFDEVVATFVFCSVPDPVQGLREALRVTKSGGRMMLLEHVLSGHWLLARLMCRLDKPVHWMTGSHIARETVDNVHRAGWMIDRVVPLTANKVFRRIEARKP